MLQMLLAFSLLHRHSKPAKWAVEICRQHDFVGSAWRTKADPNTLQWSSASAWGETPIQGSRKR